MEIYLDGPFLADASLSEDEKRAFLAKKAEESMRKMAKHNTYEYFEYKKKGKK